MSWYVILFALLAIACWLVHVWSPFGDSFGALIPRRLEDPAVAVAESHVSCQCLVVPESPCRSCVRQTSWVIQVPFTIQINTIPSGFGRDDCIPCSIYGVGAWCQYNKCSFFFLYSYTHSALNRKKFQHSTNAVNLFGEIIFFEEKLDVELQAQVLKLGLFCTKCYPIYNPFGNQDALQHVVRSSSAWQVKKIAVCVQFFIFRGT